MSMENTNQEEVLEETEQEELVEATEQEEENEQSEEVLAENSKAKVKEEDEARGQTHRLYRDKIISDQSTENSANNWKSNCCEAFDVASCH